MTEQIREKVPKVSMNDEEDLTMAQSRTNTTQGQAGTGHEELNRVGNQAYLSAANPLSTRKEVCG